MSIVTMEVDECSANGDSGAEEDEDDDLSQASGSNTSTSNSNDSSSSSESGEDSEDDQATSVSDVNSSFEDEDDKNDDDSQREEREETEDLLRWETCIAAGVKLKLPQDLCEHASIFRELLSYPRLWQESLSDSQKENLYNLLPQFPKDCNPEIELEKTVQMLLDGENDRFGVAPLDSFHRNLSTGYFRPDIRRIRNLVRKAQHKRALFEERKHAYELANQLLKSRENLLLNAYKQGFSQTSHRTVSKLHWKKPKPALAEEKAQLRYMEEMNSLRTELGASANFIDESTSENEENYPQFHLNNSKQKKKKRPTLAPQIPLIRGMQMNEDDAIRPVFSTHQRSEYIPRYSMREQSEDSYRTMLVAHKKRRTRRDNHPELNTQGISLPDLMQRAQIGQKHKLTSPGPIRLPPAKKRIKLDQHPSFPPLPKIISNVIKHESDNSDYSHTTDDNKNSSFSEIEHKSPSFPIIKVEPPETCERPQPKQKMTPVIPKSNKTHPMMIPISEVKREVEDLEYETRIKIEPQMINENIRIDAEEDEDDKKELDLDSIDMMQLPIQLDDGIDILNEVKCEAEEMIMSEKEVSVTGGEELSLPDGGDIELMQETHACFFSLLRDAFLSKGEYRMNTTEMKEAVMLWQGNPISPLNDWYSMAPSWTSLVPLALGFLAGELTYPQDSEQSDGEQELVPYLENKGRGIYAWIGAGRDSDLRLTALCARFLLHRDELGPPQAILQATNTPKNQIQHASVSTSNSICSTLSSNRPESPISESVGPDTGLISSVAEWEPPRALYSTDWKVRPSTFEEREEFRRQERMRYAAPHKAFTYRMHGYSSVVGPVKGIYQHNVGSGLTKPRGHSLLVADRPNFVTILALVRDATARLPNGEGTRADICQLLKDSQYIREIDENDSNHDKEGNLHSVVSGALDRLHYEADPCVRYYPRRKEWLYLHRARSESEFEMFHQQFQGVPKNKKSSSGSSRNKSLQTNAKLASNKDQSHSQSGNTSKETTPKKEKKSAQSAPVITRKETRKAEEKIVLEQPTPIEPPSIIPSNPPQITTTSSVSVVVPSSTTSTSSISSNASSSLIIPRETSLPMETRTQITPPIKKVTPSPSVKNVAVVKANSSQSLLQSNQQHFPPHQIQVSTSAGLQTIRLSGHSVLHSAQTVSNTMTSSSGNTSPNIATIFPNAKVQNQQQQTVIGNQGAKSILQTTNLKTQQHVLPGKTLLSSQIKLVSSGQIKSLLSGHGLQGQTIFIKQSSIGSGQTQQIQQQQQQQQLKQQQQHQQQQQQQIQQRIVTANQQQLQNPQMQRIITQIGGKPIAVQIQQSPQQQQQQQQKILAKVLTSAGGGQLISVESLLAQKGLKLATPTGHTTQINRQGKQVIQTQYQVVSQAQTSSVPPKIIVSNHQQQQGQGQTVRMVTAQLAGKPIVLASGSKGVGVGGSTGVILGKQSPQGQSSQQQPIILPSQLLNIKTLHGLKVIPTAAGLKTTGAAVYARVIAPTTISSTQTTANQQQTVQTQPPRTNSYTP